MVLITKTGLNHMLEQLLQKSYSSIFNLQCKKIRETPPIKYRYRSDLKIVTQVHHAAVDMYLVAIKSFLYHFGSGSIEVLTDGSLTDDDIALLKQHIPAVNVTEMEMVDTGTCPQGACWERLVFILDLAKDAFVIQLDSDTISLSPMPEIQSAIEDERGFSIGNPRWPLPVVASYLSDVTSMWNSNHVQVEAEKVFQQLAFFQPDNKYIRGCAAFSGFPKSQVSMEMLEDFSQQVSQVIGKEKWSEWGSEQVSSNVMVAQTNNPFVLPWPRYQNFKFPIAAKDSIYSTALIHFIGSTRYQERQYEKLVTTFIKTLMAGNQ